MRDGLPWQDSIEITKIENSKLKEAAWEPEV